jgi:hypothetical protein
MAVVGWCGVDCQARVREGRSPAEYAAEWADWTLCDACGLAATWTRWPANGWMRLRGSGRVAGAGSARQEALLSTAVGKSSDHGHGGAHRVLVECEASVRKLDGQRRRPTDPVPEGGSRAG